MLTTEEQYTRSTVVGYLNQTPVESFSVREVMDSLDDVCQDACIEEKSELICRSCPVPRLIASLLKRAGAINCHDETAGRETAGRETVGNARR